MVVLYCPKQEASTLCAKIVDISDWICYFLCPNVDCKFGGNISERQCMITIKEYPRQFELDGQTIVLDKRLFKRINQGKEEKCSFEGEIVGYQVSQEIGEYVIVLKYNNGYYCMSRKNGWFGPYREVSEIRIDAAQKISYVKGCMELRSFF